MPTRFVLATLLLAGMMAPAASAPRRVYVVRWTGVGESLEGRALVAQADRQLRDELTRRGGSVVEQSTHAIVLKPSLEIFPRALRLSLVGLKDQRLLGTISTKAAGSNREAQLKAIVGKACSEAELLE